MIKARMIQYGMPKMMFRNPHSCNTRSHYYHWIKIMGYKILDVKTDIHEDVESYMKGYRSDMNPDDWKNVIKNDILDIVDKHFEKIER